MADFFMAQSLSYTHITAHAKRYYALAHSIYKDAAIL